MTWCDKHGAHSGRCTGCARDEAIKDTAWRLFDLALNDYSIMRSNNLTRLALEVESLVVGRGSG